MLINIFKNKNLKINLPTFVDSRALICANSGGGKSYAVRKILEESSNKVMSIILDVEGEFRTLREKFDFLLISNEGDVKLNMKSARLIPKKIMELEVSTIIDISDLKRSERIKYVKDFLEGLMELPRKGENDISYWKPCLIVLDEAHLLAGQQEKQDSCSSVIDLMTRGRKRGYCGILCTQRISKLHKDAVAEANNIMIGRTGLDIDMKRASEILGFTSKQDMLTLRDLEAGEFYVFGTAISRHVTKAFVDEVQTTHPKVGMDLRKEIIKPTDNIIKILSKIKDLPQEAEKELKDLKDYKEEVARLKKELAQRPKEQIVKEVVRVDERQIEIARQQAFKEAEIQYYNGFKRLEHNLNNFKKIVFKFIENINEISNAEIPKLSLESIKPNPFIKQIKSEEKPILHPKIEKDAIYVTDSNISLNLCARKVYSLLFENSDRDFTRSQIAVLTGYSLRSSGFINAISQLNVNNLIKKVRDRFTINEVNQELATENIGEFSKEQFIAKLHKCPRDIFKFLLKNPHDEFTKEEIAENTNYSLTSSGFINSISKLNVLELIQRNGNIIKLNPEILEI